MSQIILQNVDFSTLSVTPGNFILGVDLDGLPKLLTSNELILLGATGSTILGYNEVIYSEFVNLIDQNELKIGSVYLLTDFRTSQYVQYTDTNGDGTSNDEFVNVGSTEPLLIVAIDTNKYNPSVKSLLYPDDEIIWKHDIQDRKFDYCELGGTGHIIYRKTILNNSRDYDFRNVIFRRWDNGLGDYTIVRKIDAPDEFQFVDVYAFEENDYKNTNNTIKSVKNIIDFSVPYYLDNLIVSTYSNFSNNKIEVAYNVNIFSDIFINNEIDNLFYTDFLGVSSSIIHNKIKSSNKNIFLSDVHNNNFNSLYGNTFSNVIIDNNMTSIENSELNLITSNNINSIINSNITEIVNNIGQIVYNVESDYIESNIFNTLENVNVDTIESNEFGIIKSIQCPLLIGNKIQIIENLISSTVSNNIISKISNININGVISNNISNEILNIETPVTELNYNTVNIISNNGNDGSINYNKGTEIRNNYNDGDVNNNNVNFILDNTSDDDIIRNNGLIIASNSCGLIEENTFIDFKNNTLGDYIKNNINYILDNEIETTQNNIGFIWSENTGTFSFDNNIHTYTNNNIIECRNNRINTSQNNTLLLLRNNISDIISTNFNSENISYNNVSTIVNNQGKKIENNNMNEIANNVFFEEISFNSGSVIDNNIFNPTLYSNATIVMTFSGTPSIGDLAIIEYAGFSQSFISATDSQIGFIDQLYNLFPDFNSFTATYSSNEFILTAPSSTISYDGEPFNFIVSGTISNVDNLVFSGVLDDLNIDVTGFTSSSVVKYLVIINSVTPDSFVWFDDQGNSGSTTTITAFTTYTLSFGVEISFDNSTGHNIADNWDFDVIPNLSNISATFSEQFFGENQFTANYIKNSNINTIKNNQYIATNNSSGIRISASSGNNYILENVKNINFESVIISNDIRNHNFLDAMEFVTLTPSNNMQFATQSTVSRYLTDLNGYYEEIANSTGLTWSGPIA
jgi:hypothetical protein